MNHNYSTKPMELDVFNDMEQRNLQASLSSDVRENAIVAEIQQHYCDAASDAVVEDSELIIYHLLSFTHYHFLFAVSCNRRCHLAESFSSARSAIDAALIAAQIIDDRKSQQAYFDRQKPFDKLIRHFKNLIEHKRKLPHHLVPYLIDMHQKISSFASHADVSCFVHRSKSIGDKDRRGLVMEYFQFAENDVERSIHNLNLLQCFVLVLDVFSNFLLTEQKLVEDGWVQSLHALGLSIENEVEQLKAKLGVRKSQ